MKQLLALRASTCTDAFDSLQLAVAGYQRSGSSSQLNSQGDGDGFDPRGRYH